MNRPKYNKIVRKLPWQKTSLKSVEVISNLIVNNHFKLITFEVSRGARNATDDKLPIFPEHHNAIQCLELTDKSQPLGTSALQWSTRKAKSQRTRRLLHT